MQSVKRIIQLLNERKRQIATTVVGSALTCYLITSHVATTAIVTGSSMVPTFNSSCKSSRVLVDRITPVTKIKPGEIILCHDPEEYGQYIVKRVTALAGQLVEVEEQERGAYARRHVYEGKLSVPTGYCWVEGDNRGASHDSREFGPVPLGLIQGRVLCTLWSGLS